MGIDEVGIDKVGIDEVGRYPRENPVKKDWVLATNYIHDEEVMKTPSQCTVKNSVLLQHHITVYSGSMYVKLPVISRSRSSARSPLSPYQTHLRTPYMHAYNV